MPTCSREQQKFPEIIGGFGDFYYFCGVKPDMGRHDVDIINNMGQRKLFNLDFVWTAGMLSAVRSRRNTAATSVTRRASATTQRTGITK